MAYMKNKYADRAEFRDQFSSEQPWLVIMRLERNGLKFTHTSIEQGSSYHYVHYVAVRHLPDGFVVRDFVQFPIHMSTME